MKTSFILSVLFCLSHILGAAPVEVVGQSYQFSIPEDVQFESKAEHEFYSFRWGQAESIQLLMLYPNPASSSAKMVKPMADMMAISFEDNLDADSGLSLSSSTRESVEFGPFVGEQLTFVLEADDGISVTQIVFVLHDGRRIWNGQLSGTSADGIERTKAILGSAVAVGAVAEEPQP